MDKFGKILKNTLLFLAIFLVINYLMSSCQNQEENIMSSSGNLYFATAKEEYSRSQVVNIEIKNGTEKTLLIPNECPNEPFTVLRYENNNWVKKSVTPELDCSNAEDIKVEPGEESVITYDNWNYALFSEMGRFRIEFETELNGKPTTVTSNEFLIVKEGLLRQLWNAVFYKPIYNGLIFLTSVLPAHDLGFAIILLTLIIRTILLIPSQKAMKAQRKMQELQPRLEKIKEKYKGDQQKIAMETMAVWKEAKANPMGSCLPLLMQFPFLIAVFYVVKGGLNPDNAHLLYTTYQNFTLHDINVNFLGILDLTKINLYVLPLIIGGLQFIQMKLTMAKNKKKEKNKDKKGKDKKKDEMAIATGTMAYIMPVMIAVFTASLPAGVGIYWGTSTLYGIIQQLFVNKSVSEEKEPKVRVIESKKD